MLSLAFAPLRSAMYGALSAWMLVFTIAGAAPQPPPPPGGNTGASQVPPTLPPEMQKVSEAFAKANKLFANKQYAEALGAYQAFVQLATVVKLNSGAILSGYSNMAVIYHTVGDNKGYAETLRKIINLDPTNAAALVQLALTESVEHHYADAERYANKVLALKSSKNIDAAAHFVKGNIAVSRQDFVTAAKEFAEAARLVPTDAMAHFNCALALGETKRYAEAQKELEMAHKIDPKDARINDKLTMLKAYLAAQKAHPGAPLAPSSQYDAILKKDPHNGPALLGRARLLAQMGHVSEAEAAYIRAILVLPDSYEAHFNLAHLYLMDNNRNFDHAKEHYKKAQQIAEKAGIPDKNANATGGLADAELQNGSNAQDYRGRAQELSAAETHIKQAIEIEPKQEEFKSLLCRIYEAQARFKDAASIYREMLAVTPDSLPLYARLANTYKAVRDVPGFVSVWKEYQVRKPDDPNSYEYITEMYNQVGKYQEAADTLQKMMKRKLTNSVMGTAMVILGQDLVELKRIDEGRAEFKKVLELTPSKVPAVYLLGERAALETAQRSALKALAGQAAKENKFDEAIGYLNDLKKAEAELYRSANQPPDSEVYKNIAALYEQSKRTDKAIAEYTDMAKALPSDSTPHEEMGRLLESLKKIDAATAEYKRAAQLNTKDPAEDLIKISELYQRNGMLDKAVTELEAINKAYPKKVEVLTALALIYRRTHQDEKALKIYDDIINANPTQAWVQDARAQLLTNLHRYKEAENVFVQEITRNPKAGRQTYADLARVYGLDGRADEFLELMKPRFEKDPSNSTAMAVVYDEFVRQKKETEGRAYISGVMEKTSGIIRRNCLVAYATLLQVNKHNAESLEIYRGIAKENPKDISAWVDLADQLDYNKMIDEANQIYVDQAARQDIKPDDRFGLRYKLATRYFQQNKLQDARAAFQVMFNNNKANFDVALRLGDLIEKTGTTDEAINFYRGLLSMQYYVQAKVDVRDRLGLLYEKVNKNEDAVAQFKDALSLSPDDAIANAQLKKLPPKSASASAH